MRGKAIAIFIEIDAPFYGFFVEYPSNCFVFVTLHVRNADGIQSPRDVQ